MSGSTSDFSCTFPQVSDSQKISSLPFHKFVFLVSLIAEPRRNNNAVLCLVPYNLTIELVADQSFMCVQFQVELKLEDYLKEPRPQICHRRLPLEVMTLELPKCFRD
ncbi:hypothetical protein SADUNF_Sadunf19G0042600 [Salix dunnii]|uniref:Uncharacterized protein n=1 Tax=Salix dunnii TaxID=1413687 RepID=A0A835J375_9ROSI|nr:hypothetical protein SADUNF_Sadunf19G0042600 [Salix dunnii]